VEGGRVTAVQPARNLVDQVPRSRQAPESALDAIPLDIPVDVPRQEGPEAHEQAAAESLHVSIIIPTRNEAGNVAELLRRIDQGVGDLRVETLFVDDSDDETPQRVLEAGALIERPVRLLHRAPGDRADGLGGAVVKGLAAARAPWVVVMDGDLQHPPELVPQLLRAAAQTQADIVVASRYTAAGDATGLSNRGRTVASRFATVAARLLFPRRLRVITDPMSGFFALRVAAVDYSALRPKGFKILLEIVLRGDPLKAVEVPFQFGPRLSGQSKASVQEGVRLLRQLFVLRAVARGVRAPGAARLVRAAGFGAVGLSGLAVNTLLLWFLADPAGLHMHYLWASILATQGSTVWNFVLSDLVVFRRMRSGSLRRRFLRFALLNNGVLVLRLPLLLALVAGAHLGYVAANVITLVLAFLCRFHVADRFIYPPEVSDMRLVEAGKADVPRQHPAGAGEPLVALDPLRETPVHTRRRAAVDVVVDLTDQGRAAVPHRGTGYLPHRYDIGGIVTVGSEVALPELEYFRAPALGRGLDIEIRVGTVGRVRHRARLSRSAGPMSLRYEEHLGRLGANFQIDTRDSIELTVTPLLARSPHVLYTNVLEALLRFTFVHQGSVLLHSACLELEGRGVMLSAKTDTGKTGTILRLLREQPTRFLSDDMTILQSDGTAYCFPKPLTISHHTLRAVDPGDLSAREWRKLKFQSRLHSKEGRQWGMLLGEFNVPLMSMNAITQMVVPPPKYAVDRLVPTDVCRSVLVDEMFIIERGMPRLADVDHRTALAELIENTDDAYGFPPFRYFAPAIVLGQDDYDVLRDKETSLLSAALAGIRVRRLASDSFSWADEIPGLLKAEALAEERFSS
jgi:glycosyltransferase involved in cell wall biosynthesis